jgi:hypothetical protein
VPASAAADPTATFTAKSYAPGDWARLVVTGISGPIDVEIERVGFEQQRAVSDAAMSGVAVENTFVLGSGGGVVPMHWWPSGVYFAHIRARGVTLFAPFVLRATPMTHARVAIVVPTNTWEAYNFRDGGTWYAGCGCSVDMRRPFEDRGVPPHYRQYDEGFLRWAAQTDRQADYLTDDDLGRFVSGDELARLYDLVVFPGHTEYVTTKEYDVVERFRDLGGNLMFLSANNFFWQVRRDGGLMTREGKWRAIGRPEAALIGAEYAGWNERTFGNAPYTVTDTAAAPWLFAGTGLHDGSRFGRFGIEIDERTSDSPPGTRVLCEIPNAFGAGMTAQMTYYETPRGAKVFAAGVMNFGGWAEWRPVRTLLDNLWARLSQP